MYHAVSADEKAQQLWNTEYFANIFFVWIHSQEKRFHVILDEHYVVSRNHDLQEFLFDCFS